MTRIALALSLLFACTTTEPPLDLPPDAAPIVEPKDCGPRPEPPGDLTPVDETPELVTFTTAQHERITRFVDQATSWIGCQAR